MTPSFGRCAEVTVYSLISFLPYMITLLYLFRDKLRYKKNAGVALLLIVCVVQIGLGFWAAFINIGSSGIISIISTAIYFLFFFMTVKANFGKMLFTLLLFSNLANFVVVSSKCLEGIIFPQMAEQDYRWSFSLIMAVFQLTIGVPIVIYIKNIYSKAMASKTDNIMWRYLWLIPGTFYMIWYQGLYLSRKSPLEYALNPSNAIFLLLIDVGSFLVYHIVVRLSFEQQKSMELEEKNHQYSMQSMQYENLKERINEARKANHDIRHHIALMNSYLDIGAYDELRTYLSGYIKTLPEAEPITFCENLTVNTMLMYFSQLSKRAGINFSATVSIPEKLWIADSDISVLFGNLLENSVEACKAQTKGERFIKLRCVENEEKLLITIDNTYEKSTVKNEKGVYISTKHSGNGIGIESVKDIIKRYDGIFKTEQNNGIFYASVMLENKSG